MEYLRFIKKKGQGEGGKSEEKDVGREKRGRVRKEWGRWERGDWDEGHYAV